MPRAADEFCAAIAPWTSPETTPNFAGPATFDRAWPAATAERLARIRSEVDPNGLFEFIP